jgi:hypothetical protein
MRCHFIPIRMGIIKEKKCWETLEPLGTENGAAVWKIVWWFLKKLKTQFHRIYQ